LSLQIRLPIYRAVKESLETQIPHEVFDIFSRKKVPLEIIGEVIDQLLKVSELFMGVEALPNGAMEHTEVHIVGIDDLVEKFRIFLLENGAWQTLVSDGLTLILVFRPIDGLWMLYHNVEPNVWLYLLDDVSEL
jgi:hypothetical protein